MTGDTGRRWRALGLSLGWLLGAVGGAAASLALFMVDDSCPQWAGEGGMAAPHSPYSRIMCTPQSQEPPFVVVVGLAAALALALLVWWLVRTPRTWPRAVGATLTLLLAPALIVGLLHLTLPKDCLGGRTSAGNCSRDRESR